MSNTSNNYSVTTSKAPSNCQDVAAKTQKTLQT